MKRILFAVALVLAPSLVSAQVRLTEHTLQRGEGAAPATAPLDELSWLVGRWTGEGLGGRLEEIWAPADGGAMAGMFRLIRDGETAIYEIFTLRDAGDGLKIRLKHFETDLTAWEERDEFVEFEYIGTKDGAVHFDGLTYRRDGEDEITVFLALREKDGTAREEALRMRRSPF
ncbi:MAG: DUF6265 family protein [Thermoanaerobaculia bacterium]